MNKKNILSQNGIKYIALILLLLSIIVALIVVGYFANARFAFIRPSGMREFSAPISGNVEAIAKNRPTRDKKFVWVEVEVQWEISKFVKPSIYSTKSQLVNIVNKYIGFETKATTVLVLLRKTSQDIFNQRRQIEEQIMQGVSENTANHYASQFVIKIASVEIKKIRTFSKPYKGEKLPPYKKGPGLSKVSKIKHTLADGTEITIPNPDFKK